MEIYYNGQYLPTQAEARKLLTIAAIHGGDDPEEYLAILNRAMEGDEYAIDDVFRLSGYTMEIME